MDSASTAGGLPGDGRMGTDKDRMDDHSYQGHEPQDGSEQDLERIHDWAVGERATSNDTHTDWVEECQSEEEHGSSVRRLSGVSVPDCELRGTLDSSPELHMEELSPRHLSPAVGNRPRGEMMVGLFPEPIEHPSQKGEKEKNPVDEITVRHFEPSLDCEPQGVLDSSPELHMEDVSPRDRSPAVGNRPGRGEMMVGLFPEPNKQPSQKGEKEKNPVGEPTVRHFEPSPDMDPRSPRDQLTNIALRDGLSEGEDKLLTACSFTKIWTA